MSNGIVTILTTLCHVVLGKLVKYGLITNNKDRHIERNPLLIRTRRKQIFYETEPLLQQVVDITLPSSVDQKY